MPPTPGSYSVLYDRDCGFCRWSLDKILAWDRRRRLRPVAIQSEEGQRLLAPVPPEHRLDSWHLVLPCGRPLAALLRAFPHATERAYRWVADHRDVVARLLRIDASCNIRR